MYTTNFASSDIRRIKSLVEQLPASLLRSELEEAVTHLTQTCRGVYAAFDMHSDNPLLDDDFFPENPVAFVDYARALTPDRQRAILSEAIRTNAEVEPEADDYDYWAALFHEETCRYIIQHENLAHPVILRTLLGLGAVLYSPVTDRVYFGYDTHSYGESGKCFSLSLEECGKGLYMLDSYLFSALKPPAKTDLCFQELCNVRDTVEAYCDVYELLAAHPKAKSIEADRTER